MIPRTLNALAFSGILFAGIAIGEEDWITALALGCPSGLLFGITFFRGFPLVPGGSR